MNLVLHFVKTVLGGALVVLFLFGVFSLLILIANNFEAYLIALAVVFCYAIGRFAGIE